MVKGLVPVRDLRMRKVKGLGKFVSWRCGSRRAKCVFGAEDAELLMTFDIRMVYQSKDWKNPVRSLE